MKHKTRGIALHVLNYSDSSIIIKILTRNFGLRSYMVKGIASKKSKARKALFQPLNLLDLEVSETGKDKIEIIYEARNNPVYKSINQNIYKTLIGQFLAEFLIKTLKEENIDEELFAFIEDSLIELDSREENYSSLHLKLMLDLTRYMGFYPSAPAGSENWLDLEEGVFVLKPEHGKLYADTRESRLLLSLINDPDSLNSFNREMKQVLLSVLLRYYECHVPGMTNLRSVKVLEEVLD